MGHHLEPRTSAEAEAWANTKEGLAGSGTRLRSKHAKHIHVHTRRGARRLTTSLCGVFGAAHTRALCESCTGKSILVGD